MKFEMLLGFFSFSLNGLGMLAQSEIPSSISGLVMQYGGLGLAIWLVIHHTTVTMPNIQREHRAERLEMLTKFEESLKEKRLAYFAELERMRNEGCKFKNS